MPVSPFEVYYEDLGRGLAKTANDGELTDTFIPHVEEISIADYEDAMERIKHPTADFLLINNRAFVVGTQADYYGLRSRKATAARYTRENFGVLAMSGVLRYDNWKFDSKDVVLMVSHPPADTNNKPKMLSSLLGEWRISSYNREVVINVQKVYTEEEPVALVRKVQLNPDGTYNPNSAIRRRTLFCDGGGATFDLTGTDIDGRLINALTGSRPIGINMSIESFERAIRSKHKKFFENVEYIDPMAIRDAFATGIFNGAGHEIDCTAESHQEKMSYLNRAWQFIQDKTGGIVNFDTVFLGGGAAGLLNEDFKDALEHGNVHYVDNHLPIIHEAGVRGLRAQYRQWRAMKLVP